MKFQQNVMSVRGISWLKLVYVAGFIGMASLGCDSQPPSSPTPPANSLVETPASPVPQTSVDSTSKASSQPTSSQESPLALASKECKIVMAKIADPNPPTNVRSSPEVKPDNIIGQIENGRIVGVNQQKDEWLEISEPAGWISMNVTETTCSEKTEQISFDAGEDSATISGEFIGTGSHTYLLEAQQGQTMKVTALEGPLPFIFPPNDPNRQNDLTGGGSFSNNKIWTGTLPATGEYTLAMESNFRGFTYRFSVEIE